MQTKPTPSNQEMGRFKVGSLGVEEGVVEDTGGEIDPAGDPQGRSRGRCRC